MGIGPIVSLAGSYISSLLSGPASAAASTVSTPLVKQDTSLVPPFAQILGSLQQLQQSSAAQYSQVTNQIAANLQTGAQSATSGGNAVRAAQLTQLSKDFQTASSSGQLPNVADLAQAVGGGRHGVHHLNIGGLQAPTSAATDPLAIIAGGLTNSAV